jgi:diguanylate cyclase (GGDEF)-like protein
MRAEPTGRPSGPREGFHAVSAAEVHELRLRADTASMALRDPSHEIESAPLDPEPPHVPPAATATPARAPESPLTDDVRRAALATLAPPSLVAVAVWLLDAPGSTAALLILLSAALSCWVTVRHVLEPVQGALHTARADHARARLDLAAEQADQDLRNRLERALRGSASEPASLRIGLRAVAEAVPQAEVTLLLNVPDEPRIGWQVALRGGELEQAEPVPGAPTCAALAQGAAVVTTAASLEACGHLSELDSGAAAACVPMPAAERTIGSVCVTTAPGEPLDARTLELVRWIVERTGHRTAEHRSARGPISPNRTDPLTGLPSAAALRPHLREMVRSLSPFCLAVVEIDRFEELDSDEDADAALVWVAQALCETLRPDDMICRLDQVGFAAVLRQCSAEQAVAVMERFREGLVLLLAEDAGMHLSCSAGVVESQQATSLEEIVDLAMTACDEAAEAGGNRVAVAGRDVQLS